MRTKAEAAAQRIRAAIQEERDNGVNVTLDWDEVEDGGVVVALVTSIHQRQPDGYMKIVDGPFLVME